LTILDFMTVKLQACPKDGGGNASSEDNYTLSTTLASILALDLLMKEIGQ
jgi:hypothetical protein